MKPWWIPAGMVKRIGRRDIRLEGAMKKRNEEENEGKEKEKEESGKL